MANNLDYVHPNEKVEAEPRKPEPNGETRKRRNEEVEEEISKLSIQEPIRIPIQIFRTEHGKFYKIGEMTPRETRLAGKSDLCVYNSNVGICLVHDPSRRQPDATTLTVGDVMCIRHKSPASIRRIIEARDKAYLQAQLENREKRQKLEDMDCDEVVVINFTTQKGADEKKDC